MLEGGRDLVSRLMLLVRCAEFACGFQEASKCDIWERSILQHEGTCSAEESFVGVRRVVGHSLLVRFMMPS